MSIKIHQIVQEFSNLVELERGSGEESITNLRAPENADTGSMIFVNTPEHLRAALNSPAAKAWVINKSLLAQAPANIPILLTSKRTQLAMAKIARRFFADTKAQKIVQGPDIHPTAVIATSAQIGAGCRVAPGVVIGEGCKIGANCVIGANSVIEPDVKIGERTHIHPLVFIGRDCEIGSECDIKSHSTIGSEGYGFAQDEHFNHHRITHYGRVVIGDRVHIGASVQIDRGTFLDSSIGNGTKIDNHCHFAHNIVIGQNTLITGGLIAAGSTTIGNYCVIGGRTTIKGHLTVADRVQVAGISAIGNNIREAGEYGGFPLQPIKEELRTRASLKKLPQMVKQLRQIMKHLGLKDD